jgi:acyl-coenzyme A synthetase/AMP-(fatty) acid ligase
LHGKDGNDLPTLVVVSASPDLADDDLDEIFARLRASAPARFRVARMIRLRDPLPRTATGKIRRRILAQEFESREEGT